MKLTTLTLALALLAPLQGRADSFAPPAFARQGAPTADCFLLKPPLFAEQDDNRLLRYHQMSEKHRVAGLASYYSAFFDGRKTANGEIYRNGRISAAHLTLPLGTWIEVTARATGKKLRVRVNDRGPYAKKFVLDLSQAAARVLGVDKSRDRHVEIRIVGLPGEEPLPDEGLGGAAAQLAIVD